MSCAGMSRMIISRMVISRVVTCQLSRTSRGCTEWSRGYTEWSRGCTEWSHGRTEWSRGYTEWPRGRGSSSKPTVCSLLTAQPRGTCRRGRHTGVVLIPERAAHGVAVTRSGQHTEWASYRSGHYTEWAAHGVGIIPEWPLHGVSSTRSGHHTGVAIMAGT